MHIFITGVAGFLGSNLADFYLKKNYKVSGCDTLIGGSIDNLDKKVNFYNTMLISNIKKNIILNIFNFFHN
jgi:nucleoside-diphosphate-sugar epimerase